jgi:transposase
MVRYDLDFKVEVVESVLKKHYSFGGAAIKYGLDKKNVRIWVAIYKYHGVDGFKPKRTLYDRQQKIYVVEYMLTNCLSIFETMAMFNISRSLLREWRRIYFDNGFITELEPMKKEPKNVEAELKELKEKYRIALIKIDYLEKKDEFLEKKKNLAKEIK